MKHIKGNLFIPLKKEHYEAFLNGTKRRGPSGFMEEYRLAGGQWNFTSCAPGRGVTISCGYGTARRLTGVIKGFRVSFEEAKRQEFIDIYGQGSADFPHTARAAACIAIDI